MNWLAHILLAGENQDYRLGGVLADLLTMPQINGLPPGVRHGVALHYAIDAFSDAHPAVCASVRRISSAGVGLRPAAAAIAVDVLYDHLLARHWSQRCPTCNLETFSADFYRLAERTTNLPPTARTVFDVMQAENWLLSYRDLGEIRNVLARIRRRLSPRAASLSPLASAVDIFISDQQGFEEDFSRFWPDVATCAATFINTRRAEIMENEWRLR